MSGTSLYDLQKKQEFLYCPFHDCNGSFRAPWENYTAGTTKDGMTMYKCPVCNRAFTCDDLSINAVRVPHIQNGLFVFFEEKKQDIVFTIPSKNQFTDGVDWYVHVPSKVLNMGLRMFSLNNIGEHPARESVINIIKAHLEDARRKQSGKNPSTLDIKKIVK